MNAQLIAHRGDSAHAPENTLPAFEQAVFKGADWIELDLQLSADQQVVVFHDDTLWRLARRRGRVREFDAASLATVDVGRRMQGFEDVGIPTLQQVLGGVGRKLPLYLELKSLGGGRRSAHNRLLLERCLEMVPSSSRHVLASFDVGLVRGALEEGRKAVLILSDPAAFDRLSPAGRASLYALSARHDRLKPPLLRKVAQAGTRLWTWTVDGERKLRKVLDLGVEGICSNDTAASRKFLDAHAAPSRRSARA